MWPSHARRPPPLLTLRCICCVPHLLSRTQGTTSIHQLVILPNKDSTCSMDSHHQAHSTDSHLQPHSMDSHLQPHSMDSHLQPHSTDSHLQPHSTDSHLQPHSTDSHHQPHNMDSHLQPHSMDSHHQEHSMDKCPLPNLEVAMVGTLSLPPLSVPLASAVMSGVGSK